MVVLLIAFFVFAGLYADVLWYRQLGYLPVLTTEWLTIASLFVIGFVGMAAPVYVSIQLAYRLRPVYAKLTAQLDRYQQVIEPLRRIVMLGIPAVIGLFAAVSAATRWQSVLLFLHGGGTGKTDPQFNLDDGFYLFQLPVLHGLAGYVSAVLVISILAAAATSYLYGAIRVAGREVRVSRAARVQIAVTFAVFLVVQACSLFLDQFLTLTESSGGDLFTGAGYADVNAVIPSRLILAVITLLVAALFVFTAFAGRWRLPLIGTALLIVASVIIGSIYPWIVQNLQVNPSVQTLEQPYIGRAIAGTRDAYGIANVKPSTYDATTTTQPGQLKTDADTTESIRIIDPYVISPTFSQFQQLNQFYSFKSGALDVDRYTVDGKSQDTVVAARELNQSGLEASQTAFGNAFVYTHGYGLVAADGNQRASSGAPLFIEKNIPQKGSLGTFEPRIYFGEQSPTYSVVGAPAGAKPQEFDYPSNTSTADATGSVMSTFDATGAGEGGPSVGSTFNRLIYALKFQSDQILLSTAVNAKSQILYDRSPVDRVQKAAPYLTLDRDPYPSVVNGHVVWIIDGYTTSSSYPYSHLEDLQEDINSTQVAPAYAGDDINYIRNSVKATVDAYTGKVTLYAWDASDPVLRAWQNVFPTTLKPLSQMDGALMSHVRYPEDLFRVQRTVLARYHVVDPVAWFQASNSWSTPLDPTKGTAAPPQPPYYLTMQMPGQTKPAFSLFTTYIPQQTGTNARNNLTGYLAVNSDAGATAGTKASDYGHLRLLALPKGSQVSGPGQVQNDFDTNTTIQSAKRLLSGGDATAFPGNLLTLPVGGGLLYVEPLYVKSNGGTQYPLLRKILVSFGGKIAFENTLDEALNSLFNGDSGASTGDSPISTTPPASGTNPPSSSTPSAALTKALADAKQALADRQKAYADNDLVAAAQADKRLQTALQAAEDAAG